MGKRKRKIRKNKWKSFLTGRPAICKIEVEDGGKNVFSFKGRLEKGFSEFSALCIESYQLPLFENFDINIDKFEIPEILLVGGDNSGKTKTRTKR